MKAERLLTVICLLSLMCSLSFAGIIRIGLIADVHYGEEDDVQWPIQESATYGDRYLAQAEDKVDAAIVQLAADNCHVIISLGDFVEEPDNDISAIIDNFNGTDGIKRMHVIGNHDTQRNQRTVASFLAAVGQDGEENDGEYWGYDIPDSNVHCIVLNGCYYKWVATGGAVTYWQMGDYDRPTQGSGGNYVNRDGDADTAPWWLSPAQLTWLEADLATADAAGKYSIIGTHPSLLRDTIHRSNLQNADAIRVVLEQHNVIACFNGHNHRNEHGVINGILYVTLDGIVDEDFDGGAGNHAHSEFLIDDSNGNWNLL